MSYTDVYLMLRTDSGAIRRDSGTTRHDSGTTRRDAGTTRRDVGTTPRDSRPTRRDWETNHRGMLKKQERIKKWERTALSGKKHNYRDEIFKLLRDEEKRQVTPWDIVREDVAKLSIFAPERQKCIESIISLSVKYKLGAKTTEASFIQLYRFLLLPKAKSIVDSKSGVKGAIGWYSLQSIAICILMISAKYEEIYPPSLEAFVQQGCCSKREFLRLERKLLNAMKWNLVSSTPVDFLGRFLQSVRATSKTYALAMFILETSWHAEMAIATKHSILTPPSKRWKQSRYSVMPTSILMLANPSLVALGSLILSLAYQGIVCYPVTLEYSSGVRATFVSEVVRGLHKQLRRVTSKHALKPSVTVRKYSEPKYGHIGLFKPPTFNELLEHNAFRGTELATIYKQQSNIRNSFSKSSNAIVV